jgi:hypothetical protein
LTAGLLPIRYFVVRTFKALTPTFTLKKIAIHSKRKRSVQRKTPCTSRALFTVSFIALGALVTIKSQGTGLANSAINVISHTIPALLASFLRIF